MHRSIEKGLTNKSKTFGGQSLTSFRNRPAEIVNPIEGKSLTSFRNRPAEIVNPIEGKSLTLFPNSLAKIVNSIEGQSLASFPSSPAEIVKLPAHRAGLPGHAMASRMRAKEISFFIVPLAPLGSSTHWVPQPIGFLAPAYKAGLAGHLSVNPNMREW